MAAWVLCMAALLERGPVPAGALAQEAPARNAAIPKVELPQAPVLPQAAQESPPVTADALSSKYRLIEKYSTTDDPAHPELITQYRVGVLETQKTVREKAQGAPDREEITHQTIYTERVAQVGKLGEATSTVRRYDRFFMKELATARPSKPPLLEGLTVLLRRQTGRKPQLLSLTSDRPIREVEYSEMTNQVFLPQLAALLPPAPRRVRDTWSISRQLAQTLVGEVPEPDDYEMNGALLEVRKSASGTGMTAIIDISGKMNLSIGLSSLRAQLHFVFDPALASSASPAAPSTAADKPLRKGRDLADAGIVEGRGRISRVLMVWAVSEVLPDGDGRLKQTKTYELNLERRFAPAGSDAAAGPNAPLTVPEPLPAPDESNSWILYEDPARRFYFRHPQELTYGGSSDPNSLFMVERHPKGHVLLGINLQSKDSGRQNRDPEYHRRELAASWAKDQKDVVKGSADWLPDADWGPLKRKVYRIEAALMPKDQPGDNANRLYLDYYLVLLTNNESVVVNAMTERDSNIELRSVAEGLIKSFGLGQWGAQPKVPTAPAEPPPTPRN
jgi:hypothetical protein